MPRRIRMLLLLLFGVYAALRLVGLTLDPPQQLPFRSPDMELYVEGPAKAHEARKAALFGEFVTNEVDNYRFWRPQSPVWVYPLAGWFRLAGVGYLQLRVYALAVAAVGFCFLLALLARELDGWGILVGGLLVAASFYDVHYARAGLLETQVTTLSVITVICLLRSLDRLPWLVVAQWVLVATVFTKQSGIVLLPMLLGVSLVAHWRAWKRGTSPWQHALPVVHGVAIAAASAGVMLGEEYWRTVEWSFGHVLYGRERFLDAAEISGGDVVARLGALQRWGNRMLVFPVAIPLAVLHLATVAWRTARRQPVSRVEWLGIAWLLSVVLGLQLTPLDEVRFSMLLLFPLALLSGYAAMRGMAWLGQGARRDAVLAVFAMAFGATHVAWQVEWLAYPSRDLAEASRKLREALPAGAVIIGSHAAPLALESRADHFYVKGPFNSSAASLTALGVTHVLLGPRDFTAKILRAEMPGALKGLSPVLTFPLGPSKYELYALPAPLGAEVPSVVAEPDEVVR